MRAFLTILLTCCVTVVFSQYYVAVDIMLQNSPGESVEVTVVFDTDPEVTYIASTSNAGFFSGVAALPNSDWTVATASLQDCHDSLVGSFFLNDSFFPEIEVYFLLDYCADGSIYGCTHPYALNYNPISIYDDGSCEFLDQAVNDLGEDALPIHEGITWITNVNAFYEPQGALSCDYLFYDLNEASVWYTFTAPEYGLNLGVYGDGSGSLTNTQISVYDRYANGERLFCDETTESDSIILIDIGCGQLDPGATYLLKVNGVGGQMGTCFLSMEFADSCSDIWGCTNPASVNYDPAATIDDGSCFDPDMCMPYTITFNGPQNAQGTYQVMFGDSILDEGNYQGGYENVNLCVPPGCMDLVVNIPQVNGEETMVSVTGLLELSVEPSSGVGTYSFAFMGCVSNLRGCMDETAINYDPTATNPYGGICHYPPECGAEVELLYTQISCNRYLVHTSAYYAQINWTSTGGTILDEGNNYLIIRADETGAMEVCGNVGEDACGNTIQECVSLFTFQSCFDECATGIISSFENSGCNLLLGLNNAAMEESEVEWNFGDGQIQVATGSVEHQFEASGYYYVCADVVNTSCGENIICDSVLVLNCGNQTILGCTDWGATNFNPDANLNDGSCTYAFDCGFTLSAFSDPGDGEVLIVQPSIDLLAAQSVLWQFGDGASSTEMFPQHQYSGDGPYNLCLTATFMEGAMSCTHTACIVVEAPSIEGSGLKASGFGLQVINGGIVGVGEIGKGNLVELWPNPARSTVTLEVGRSQRNPIEVWISDISGRVVLKPNTSTIQGRQEMEISLKGISEGLYLVSVKTDNRTVTKKLVVVN